MKKKYIPFYVINENFNAHKFEPYDVMPYLIEQYKETKKTKRRKTPETFEEFKEFVDNWSHYQFWSRCEYEIVLSPFISRTKDEKIDVCWQIMMNIDIVTRILMENVLTKKKLEEAEK